MKRILAENSSRCQEEHGSIFSSLVCIVSILCISQLLMGCIPLVLPTGRSSMHGTTLSFQGAESKEDIPEILLIPYCRSRNGVTIECNDMFMKSFLKYPKVVSSETVLKDSRGVVAMIVVLPAAAITASSKPDQLALCVIAPGYKVRFVTRYRLLKEGGDNLIVDLEPLPGGHAVRELINMRDILEGEEVSNAQIKAWRDIGLKVFPSDPTAKIRFNAKERQIIKAFFERGLKTLADRGYHRPSESPIADFTTTTTSGTAPLSVQFTDTSYEGTESITSWSWDFDGNGSIDSTDQHPVYTYTYSGIYPVTLTTQSIDGTDIESKNELIHVAKPLIVGSKDEGWPDGRLFKTKTIMLPGDVPLEMVWIRAGRFLMGSYEGEQDSYSNAQPQHEVTLTQGFWMGKYELTKAQWEAVMGTTPWAGESFVLDDPNSPAVYVSWNDAQSFIEALQSLTGGTFRLPTEAEWEYACRAGTTTRFYWGEDPFYTAISKYAWWKGNVGDVDEYYAHVVGQKLPNAWGLYDMNGNVDEWCNDWHYRRYSKKPVINPQGPAPGVRRCIRGGAWDSPGKFCCSAGMRRSVYQSVGMRGDGFRIACWDLEKSKSVRPTR